MRFLSDVEAVCIEEQSKLHIDNQNNVLWTPSRKLKLTIANKIVFIPPSKCISVVKKSKA